MDLLTEMEYARRLPPPGRRRQLRVAARVAANRMAAELQVSPVTLWRWETGSRTPRGENLRNYVTLLSRLGGI